MAVSSRNVTILSSDLVLPGVLAGSSGFSCDGISGPGSSRVIALRVEHEDRFDPNLYSSCRAIWLFHDHKQSPNHVVLPNSEWYFVKGDNLGDSFSFVPSQFMFEGAVCPLVEARGKVLGSVNRGLDRVPIVTAERGDVGWRVEFGVSLASLLGSSGGVALLQAVWNLSDSKEFVHEIGVGVVGYGPFGGMGSIHGHAVQETPGLRLATVVDPDVARLAQAEIDFPGLKTFVNADDMADDRDTDLVVIATPPLTHFDLACKMLMAGKHVVVEKPMCLTRKEADELIEIARINDRVLTVHQNRRWDPDFVAIRNLVARGELGEVFNIETFVGGFEHPCREWHSDEDVSGGIAYDWGAHHIDWMLQLLSGSVVSVSAKGHKRKWFETSNLDQIRIEISFADGTEATFAQSDIAALRKPKFYIQGTKGTLVGTYRPLVSETVEAPNGYVRKDFHHAEAPADLILATYEGEAGIREAKIPPASVDRNGFHRNLASHLHFGTPLEVDPVQVREVISVLELAHRSSRMGGETLSVS